MTSGGSSPAGSSPAGVKKSVATPRTPRTPRTPASSARARFSKKASRGEDEEEEEQDETASEDDHYDQTVAFTPINRQRRASQPKRSYAESDAASDDEEEGFTPNKKVKKESVEEVPSTFVTPTSSALAAPGAAVPEEPEDVEFV